MRDPLVGMFENETSSVRDFPNWWANDSGVHPLVKRSSGERPAFLGGRNSRPAFDTLVGESNRNTFGVQPGLHSYIDT